MTAIPPGAVQAAAEAFVRDMNGRYQDVLEWHLDAARKALEAAEAVWPHTPDHYPGGASVDEGVRDDRRRDAAS